MNPIIEIDKNMLEPRPFRTQGWAGFPFGMLRLDMSDYPLSRFLCHWHPEVELIYVQSGHMLCQINEEGVALTPGDCLFINANALHAGETPPDDDCRFISIGFDPQILCGFADSAIALHYITPILNATHFPYYILRREDGTIQRLIERIAALSEAHDPCYQLYICALLCEFWAALYEGYTAHPDSYCPSEHPQLQQFKQVLEFIYAHYSEPITLDDMATVCHISKSEFCRRFKKSMRQTPFDFLLHYRIRKSLPLLYRNELSITEIAVQVGFSGTSYFSEIFRKFMGCSPSQYRKELSASH